MFVKQNLKWINVMANNNEKNNVCGPCLQLTISLLDQAATNKHLVVSFLMCLSLVVQTYFV